MTKNEFRSFLNECKKDYSKVIRKMLSFYDLQENQELKVVNDTLFGIMYSPYYLRLSEMFRDWIEKVGSLELEKARHNSKDEMALMTMLVSIYMEKKKFEEAESLFTEILKRYSMQAKVLGKHQVDSLKSINNLASAFCDQGQYGVAEKLYWENLPRCMQCLESGHPLLLETMSDLGIVYLNQNKTEMAEPLFQECLSSCEKCLEPGHPKTLESLLNLARLHSSRGNHKDACVLFRDCLIKCEKYLGSDHAITRHCKARLALSEKCFNDSHAITSYEAEVFNLLEKMNKRGLNCRASLEAQMYIAMLMHVQGLLYMSYFFCADCFLRSDYKSAEIFLDDYIRRQHESPLSLEDEGLKLLEESLLSDLIDEKVSNGETSFAKVMKEKLHEPWYKHPFRIFRLWRLRIVEVHCIVILNSKRTLLVAGVARIWTLVNFVPY